MKKILHTLGRIISSTLILSLSLSLSVSTSAWARHSEFMIEVNGETIDVEQLAEEYNVDPEKLREAILEGINSDISSPFSNLETVRDEDVQPTEKIEYVTVVNGNARGPIAQVVCVSKINQDSNAYVADEGALTASGKTPQVGMCAMHVDVTTKTGNTSSSTVRLGTMIYMDNPVNVNGVNYSSFVVEDRGRPGNRTPYWIDIFFGPKSSYHANAINYGVKTVSYKYYYEEWTVR